MTVRAEKTGRGGGEEAVEGCEEGRSAAALLLKAIICSDALRRLSLRAHTQTSAGGQWRISSLQVLT